MLPHVIQPAADRDLDHAINWYERKQQGLGVELLDEFVTTVESICGFPESYPLLLSPYRRALLKRFPYSVLYEVFNDTVFVHAVVHNAMDDRRALNRLP